MGSKVVVNVQRDRLYWHMQSHGHFVQLLFKRAGARSGQ